jgi:recombinational DNA repair protein (RecF pathway)
MSYTTYTTDAIVCGTYDRNTADRSYRLFTRELGMLWADARSVRLEKSKQRFALSDFSQVRVSLVRGKSGWKIGSVTANQNYYHRAVDQAARGSVVSLVRFLRRYVQGEESQVVLYDYVVAALDVVVGDVEERSFVDQVVTLRILAELGYVAKPSAPVRLIDSVPAELAGLYAPADAVVVTRLLANADTLSQL